MILKKEYMVCAMDEMKPVRCGCGGEANVLHPSYTHCIVVMCGKCGIKTPYMNSEAEAVEAWNKAMKGNAEEKLKAFWDGMSAEMKANTNISSPNEDFHPVRDCMVWTERMAKVDWINGEPFCPMCGDRLEWE